MTQLETLRRHFDSGGTLTVMEALNLYGCMALSQRVGDLRGQGYPVASEMIELPNGKRVARYFKREEETCPTT